jgi:hypothetical protein
LKLTATSLAFGSVGGLQLNGKVVRQTRKMRTRTRVAIAVLSTVILLPVAMFLGYAGYEAIETGYSWSECDWDGDGHTSILEYLDAGRFGKRRIVRDGRACSEYFSFKDGLEVKTLCPESPPE